MITLFTMLLMLVTSAFTLISFWEAVKYNSVDAAVAVILGCGCLTLQNALLLLCGI